MSKKSKNSFGQLVEEAVKSKKEILKNLDDLDKQKRELNEAFEKTMQQINLLVKIGKYGDTFYKWTTQYEKGVYGNAAWRETFIYSAAAMTATIILYESRELKKYKYVAHVYAHKHTRYGNGSLLPSHTFEKIATKIKINSTEAQNETGYVVENKFSSEDKAREFVTNWQKLMLDKCSDIIAKERDIAEGLPSKEEIEALITKYNLK